MQNKKAEKQDKQNLLIFLCWFVYTISYMGRNSYSSNITRIETFFSIKHADSGLVSTCFFVAYGIGQVVNGFLCKKYPKKYIFPIVLFLAAILNFLIAAGVPFVLYKYIWLANGFIQSVLWSSLIMTLGDYLLRDNMPRAIFLMGTTAAVGTLLASGSSSLFSIFAGFKLSFIVASVSMTIMAIIWLLLFDKSTKLGLVKNEGQEEKKQDNATGGMMVASISLLLVFLALFAIVGNLVKDGLHTWVPTILKEQYGLSDGFSIFLSLILPILGIFGATGALLLNKVFKDYILLVGILFLGSLVCLGGIIWFLQTPAWIVTLILFALVVCLVHGVNNVITSMVPIYLRDRVNSGKVAGILNGFAYVGSSISSFALGALADGNGWNTVFLLLFALNGIMVFLSISYFLIAKIKNKNRGEYNIE